MELIHTPTGAKMGEAQVYIQMIEILQCDSVLGLLLSQLVEMTGIYDASLLASKGV